ncbi:MAG: hypothetical protein RL095_318 [Verrucomicrobiota bacterium]
MIKHMAHYFVIKKLNKLLSWKIDYEVIFNVAMPLVIQGTFWSYFHDTINI